jgi:hypothetical protein
MAGHLLALQYTHDNGRKRPIAPTAGVERPEKRKKPLLEDDTSNEDSGSSASGGVALERTFSSINTNGFTVNQDFARRFEHNKEREELQKRTCGQPKNYFPSELTP